MGWRRMEGTMYEPVVPGELVVGNRDGKGVIRTGTE